MIRSQYPQYLIKASIISITMSKDSKAGIDIGCDNNDQTINDGLGTITDHHDVFGEISEDGPNYRNVSKV